MRPHVALAKEKARQAKEIRDLMEAKGVSIIALSESLGISNTTINKLSRNKPIEGVSLDKMFMIKYQLDRMG